MLLFFILQMLLLIRWSLKAYGLLKRSTRTLICLKQCPLFPKMTAYFSNQYQFTIVYTNIFYIVNFAGTRKIFVLCSNAWNNTIPGFQSQEFSQNISEMASPLFNECKSDC